MTTAERIAGIRGRLNTVSDLPSSKGRRINQLLSLTDDLKWALDEIERLEKSADDAERKLGESDRAIYRLVKELNAAQGDAK